MTRSLTALLACLPLVAGLARGAANGEVEVVHKRPYVHRIRLMDERGEFITLNSTQPYSPRKTCGACHNYQTIAGGHHFDMGASQLSDDFGKSQGKPWALSDGMVGGWLPTFRRQYARKSNRSATEIDLTAFEFVRTCGACHPGGGALEHDRDGQRYDLRLKEQPGLADTVDGDYHQARWDETGVVEIDCLLCHAQWSYDVEERTRQLRAFNYRHAATAAAGFGLVRGENGAQPVQAEFDPANPAGPANPGPSVTVAYRAQLFDAEGMVRLDIGPPPDRACLSCHHFPARAESRGRERRHWRDVHTTQGLACVDCHNGGIDHQFELGHPLYSPSAGNQPESSVALSRESAKTAPEKSPGSQDARPDDRPPPPKAVARRPTRPMSCQNCHDSGLFGATHPDHVGLPQFHLERIACVTCHAGPALGHQGEAIVYSDPPPSTPQGADLVVPHPNQQVPWQIWYGRNIGPGGAGTDARHTEAQIRVHNAQTPYWWGNRVGGEEYEEGEHLWPYFEREVAAAWKIAADRIADDDGDGVPEINTKGEIRTMDAALKQVLEGGRFEHIRPVFVKGDTAHWVHEEDIYRVEGHPDTQPLCVPLAHAVLGPQEALGAGGCTDCHERGRYFFDGDRVLTWLTYYHYPHTRSMRRAFDYPSRGVRHSAVRESAVKPYGLVLIPLALVLCLVHYVVFGPKRVHEEDPDDEVARFTLYERMVHLLQMLSFLVLAVTGMGFLLSALLGSDVPALWSSRFAELLHLGCGYVFLVTTVLMAVRWAPQAIFQDHDVRWLEVMGGYLWRSGPAPAGKFNAGQKILFWLLVFLSLLLGVTGLLMATEPRAAHEYQALIYLLHDVAALLAIAAIVGHVYLATICNPGTLRSIFEGKVTRAWARHHHSVWAEQLPPSEGPQSARPPES